MDVAGWIAIAVALIGVAGGIWAQVYQFKKDAQRIENVNQATNGVKEDTVVMKPKVERIEKISDEMKADYLRNLYPTVGEMNKTMIIFSVLCERYIKKTPDYTTKTHS